MLTKKCNFTSLCYKLTSTASVSLCTRVCVCACTYSGLFQPPFESRASKRYIASSGAEKTFPADFLVHLCMCTCVCVVFARQSFSVNVIFLHLRCHIKAKFMLKNSIIRFRLKGALTLRCVVCFRLFPLRRHSLTSVGYKIFGVSTFFGVRCPN